jgi:hypothetical protein
MKISEMTNDQAAEALLRISGPFASMADDEEFMVMMDEIQQLKSGGMPVGRATAKMIPKFITFALRRHKADLYEIIGAFTGKPNAQVAKMNLLETIQVFRESYDDLAASFFPSFGGVWGSSAGTSSARSSNTAGMAGTP